MSGDTLTIETFLISTVFTVLLAAIERSGWHNRALVIVLFALGGLAILLAIGWPAYGPMAAAIARFQFAVPTPQQLGPILVLASIFVGVCIWILRRLRLAEPQHSVGDLVRLAIHIIASSLLFCLAILAVVDRDYLTNFIGWSPFLIAAAMSFGAYQAIKSLEKAE